MGEASRPQEVIKAEKKRALRGGHVGQEDRVDVVGARSSGTGGAKSCVKFEVAEGFIVPGSIIVRWRRWRGWRRGGAGWGEPREANSRARISATDEGVVWIVWLCERRMGGGGGEDLRQRMRFQTVEDEVETEIVEMKWRQLACLACRTV